MENKEEHILELLRRYEKGTATKGELQQLDDWYGSFEKDQRLSELKTPDEHLAIRDRMLENLLTGAKEHLSGQKRTASRPLWSWPRIAVAASILICLSVGLFLYRDKTQNRTLTTAEESSILAGSNKAVLTLSNGNRIVLNDLANGRIQGEGNAAIEKTADGELAYANTANSGTGMNTLATPRGGQHHLILSDGSQVWLNAQSSITYPVSFKGSLREVRITGEAYFEVAHNPKVPFIVTSQHQSIKVLGTHFNVNAYENETYTRTTLLEGKVAVQVSGTEKMLSPGEQARASGGSISIARVDTDEATAWQRGYFDFNSADIGEVMRQISRWYDLEVTFTGEKSRETFTGRIPRSWNLGQVLKIIRASQGVNIKIQGRRIMVEG